MSNKIDNLTFAEALQEEAIFLVAGDEDSDAGPAHMFATIDDLEGYLTDLTPTVDAGTRVLHGALTTAEYIPADFKGKTPFLVCINPDDAMSVSVVESAAVDAKELADEIETYLLTGYHLQTIPDIEDIFIFYGYELSTCLAVVLDDLDDEALDTCQMIADEARRLAKGD